MYPLKLNGLAASQKSLATSSVAKFNSTPPSRKLCELLLALFFLSTRRGLSSWGDDAHFFRAFAVSFYWRGN